MKTLRTVLALSGALATLASPLSAQQSASATQRKSGTGIEMLPTVTMAPASTVTTDAEFAALRAARSGDPEALKPLPPKKHGFSLVEMSTFLTNAGQTTLLPKGSIIWTPSKLKERIVSAPASDTIPWLTFLTANRNWISTCEVSLKQVRGEKPLPAALLEPYKNRGVLVVATLNGCPVTVLPFSSSNVAAK